MNRHLEANQYKIAELCRRYDVAVLELFGSAAEAEPAGTTGDFDFIVTFLHPTAPGVGQRYMGLAEDLEELLGRPVDILTNRPFANPYFAEAVAKTRRIIYARSNEEAPV